MDTPRINPLTLCILGHLFLACIINFNQRLRSILSPSGISIVTHTMVITHAEIIDASSSLVRTSANILVISILVAEQQFPYRCSDARGEACLSMAAASSPRSFAVVRMHYVCSIAICIALVSSSTTEHRVASVHRKRPPSAWRGDENQ